MKYCRPCNRNYSSEFCSRCIKRLETVIQPHYRTINPQVWPRCHKCWSLSPCCHCDGDITMPDPLPELSVSW